MAEDRHPDAEAPPPELARLPRGRHGLPREFVVRNQRERLIAGLAESVARHGYDGTTVETITREAAVSRRTFYEHFQTREECFLAAYDAVIERLRERLQAAFDSEADWPTQIRAGIAAMLDFLVAEPALARLAMVEPFVAGPSILERYDAAVQAFVPFFRAGRERLPDPDSLPETTEETLVGGIMSLITRRVMSGDAERLDELLPDLTEFALTPYLGAAEAERLAARAVD